MFPTPYTTATHTPSDDLVRQSNEQKAFAFWQALQRTQDRFGSLFARGGTDEAPLPTNRWFPAE
jgi:hypothetical protein